MIEGWHGDDYFVLFAPAEVLPASVRYGVNDYLPGFQVVGLVGWDDLIVRNAKNQTYRVPTVPLTPEYLRPLQVPAPQSLEPDARFHGKVKWYVQPIVFGGSPDIGDNLVWLSHEDHARLVVWWNTKYFELTGSR